MSIHNKYNDFHLVGQQYRMGQNRFTVAYMENNTVINNNTRINSISCTQL